LSGPHLAELLTKSLIPVREFEFLLQKHQKTPDSEVLEKASAAGLILLTKDESMESDFIEEIVRFRARVLALQMPAGNVYRMHAAVTASSHKWERILLSNPVGPLVIRIREDGSIGLVRKEAELREILDRVLTARKASQKRHR
jgi:hypothetical protein